MIYDQVKELIVLPLLSELSFQSSPEAVELLLMTMAHESLGGEYIKQVGGGPAHGVYQMEKATHDDIWENYLKFNPSLSFDVFKFTICNNPEINGAQELLGNLYYSTVMARMQYRRVTAAIPAQEDFKSENEWLMTLAQYAKDHYNTHLGKATPRQYFEDYINWRG